jgi:hypothetical protein
MLSYLLYKDSEAGKIEWQELIAKDNYELKGVNLNDHNFEFSTLPRLRILSSPDEEITNQNADLQKILVKDQAIQNKISIIKLQI